MSQGSPLQVPGMPPLRPAPGIAGKQLSHQHRKENGRVNFRVINCEAVLILHEIGQTGLSVERSECLTTLHVVD